MKRWIKRLFLFGFLFFAAHELVMITDGLQDEKGSAEVAIILGSTVNEDGSLSPRLKARLDKGLQLYNDKRVSGIYVSGGLGKEGHYEGTAMAQYLVHEGAPSSTITIDNEGINTRSTALNFRRDFPEASQAIVVSQYFHISRCKLALRQVGIENVKGAHAEHFEWRDIYSSFREFFGFYKYLIYY